MSGTAWEIATALFWVTVVYVLVRPGSGAVEMLDFFGRGLVALVRTATDL